MDFRIHQRQHPNKPRYPSTDYDLAKKFAEMLQKELGSFLKAAVLFGSTAREEKPLYGERDIDALIIIDDLTSILSNEVVQSYRVITENTAAKVSARLHITTLKLTTFWDYVRNGDPIAINMLRDGVPLVDSGFFEPAQHLLYQGRVRPSKESVWTYFARAPATLNNADWHILQATLDLYWAVVDSAHAALMRVGEVPPTPGHLTELLNKRFCQHGTLPKRYPTLMDQFFQLQKKIIHREIQKVTGREYDNYKKDAEDFVKTMQSIVERK
ncbi:hypothetical protein HY489_05515 [Candidatus Woesearchaeota archaeon]|nr:hypothetical protein [Candidatus Woesearchaeota archaeon]